MRSSTWTSWPASPAATYSSSRGSQIMMCLSPMVCGGRGGRRRRTFTCASHDPGRDPPAHMAAVMDVGAHDEGAHRRLHPWGDALDAPRDGAPGVQALVRPPVAALQRLGVHAPRVEDA